MIGTSRSSRRLVVGTKSRQLVAAQPMPSPLISKSERNDHPNSRLVLIHFPVCCANELAKRDQRRAKLADAPPMGRPDFPRGEALQLGWRITARCAFGNNDGLFRSEDTHLERRHVPALEPCLQPQMSELRITKRGARFSHAGEPQTSRAT
jgi:hypothetical protein